MQGSHRDHGARRLVPAEALRVDLVDPAPGLDIGDVDRRLQDVIQVTPGLLQDGLQVVERLLGLRLDRRLPDGPTSRIDRQLSRNENKVPVYDRLRVMPSRDGGVFGQDDFNIAFLSCAWSISPL